MDPQACLNILAQSAAEHQRLREQGLCEPAGGQGFAPPQRGKSTAAATAASAATAATTASGGGAAAATERAAETQAAEPAPPPGAAATCAPKPAAAAAAERPVVPPPVGVARDFAAGQLFAALAQAATEAEAEAEVAACAGAARGGQVIDLETSRNETVDGGMSEAAVLELFPDLRPAPAVDGQAGAAAARGACAADLVRAFVKLHEERVKVHRAYDGAFKHLVQGKGGGAKALARTYPSVVARATFRFQQLSEGAKLLAGTLEERAAAQGAAQAELREAAALVRKVQGLEQARLQMVAISHLEQSQVEASPGSDGSEEKVAKMRLQLGCVAEEVEEAVSELRYTAAELVDAME